MRKPKNVSTSNITVKILKNHILSLSNKEIVYGEETE